ncbi:Midasin [Nymphaea thermarum]|nr:Midasin [Nymphaea thermarum]
MGGGYTINLDPITNALLSSLDTEVAEIGSYGWDNNGVAENLLGIPWWPGAGLILTREEEEGRNGLTRDEQGTHKLSVRWSTGVGKPSLVVALANLLGHNIVRINLSGEMDIMDLLGSDLPVDGETGIQFAWSDGILLQAIKGGSWALLDELNFAPQSVLEAVS